MTNAFVFLPVFSMLWFNKVYYLLGCDWLTLMDGWIDKRTAIAYAYI